MAEINNKEIESSPCMLFFIYRSMREFYVHERSELKIHKCFFLTELNKQGEFSITFIKLTTRDE